MGGCAGVQKSRQKSLPSKFTSLELELIAMMFNNLAKRCRSRGQTTIVTRETFDVFFHSCGLIGEIIFMRFDAQKNGEITFQNFLKAFELMVKGTLRERADILFDIYDVHRTGGVQYSQLIKILFSYPLPELNKMLAQQKFLEYIGPAQMGYYFGANKKLQEKYLPEREEEAPSSELKKKPSQKYGSMAVITTVNYQETLKKPAGRKDFRQDARTMTTQSKPNNNTVSSVMGPKGIKEGRKELKIQSNVASLTKKYANYLFNEYKLNKQKDHFSKQNFYSLIQEHHALFNVYMIGFHTYVWQQTEGKVQFQSLSSWIQGEAVEADIGNRRNVYLKFIRTTIFVFTSKKARLPKQIINLEGLFMVPVNKKAEYGICFKHRDGIYPVKQYFFENKQLQSQWVKQLADFKENTIFEEYSKMERIGGGNFSQVFRGVHKVSKKQVAIKIIENFRFTNTEKEVIKRQCSILSQCHHPNIVKLIGQFKTKSHWHIVTQLMSEGDLFDYTKKKGYLEEYEAALIFKQLVDAILYINNQLGIIHRDLKPQNVMIITNKEKGIVNKVKIIDFGFAIFKDKLKQLPVKEKYAGTPGFIAPEIYQMKQFDDRIDTFSLGIILYFMLSGSLPFQADFQQQIRDLTVNCDFSTQNIHWSNISDEAKQLIHKMLTAENTRISTRQVLQHSWLQNIQHLKKFDGINRKATIL